MTMVKYFVNHVDKDTSNFIDEPAWSSWEGQEYFPLTSYSIMQGKIWEFGMLFVIVHGSIFQKVASMTKMHL